MNGRPALSIVRSSTGEPVPTSVLRQRLEQFELAYEQCQYIDHWPAAEKCFRENRHYIEILRAEISRRKTEGEDD